MAPVDDVTKSDTVVEGVTALMMVKLNPSCYSGSSNDISVCQVDKVHIPGTWILIDSQSTLNLFKKKYLLTGIRTTGIRTVTNQANV